MTTNEAVQPRSEETRQWFIDPKTFKKMIFDPVAKTIVEDTEQK